MKTKHLISAFLAASLITATAVSVSAATLTNLSPDYNTEVTATIAGSGNVTYIITIPSKIDFGTLTQPKTDEDSYKYVEFEIEATKTALTEGRYISIYLKNYNESDKKFYITQQDVESPFEISYDIYTERAYDSYKTLISDSDELTENGYHITTFENGTEGAVQPCHVALNQKALYGQDLDEIAGTYSGTITFHSVIRESLS